MNSAEILKYPAVFLTAFLVTYGLTPLFIRVAPWLGLMDQPDARHAHSRPTPRGGGVAVFLGFHAGCAVLFLSPWATFLSQVDIAWWFRFLVLSTALLLVGLCDDRWGLCPSVKLAAQVAVALGAYAWGLRMGTVAGFHLPAALDGVLTVIWIVGIVNAFNLIDGMDGLASGLGVIGCAGLACSFFLRRLPGDVLTMLAMIGACLAFLRFNFSPARVFLGDAGSMFIGLTIATSALVTESKGAAATSILLPLFAAGVPLFDTVLAIWRRTVRAWLRRDSPEEAARGIASADTDHLHHRLARSGWSQRRVAFTLYLLSGALVAVGVLLTVFRSQTLGISLGAFVLGMYVVVRHLARVELWDTGTAIVKGLRRPPGRVLSVIVYPFFDIAVMGAALAITLTVTHIGPRGASAFKQAWVDAAGWWVGIPFIFAFASGTYRRVWGRARPSEYVQLGVVLTLGILLAAGVTATLEACASRAVVEMIVLYAAVVVPVLVGARTLGQLAQDGMSWLRRVQDPGTHRVLLYGGGRRCMLYLRGLSYGDAPDRRTDANILGLMDDDANLHGRTVYGHRVVGGLDALAAGLLPVVDEIVVVADLSEAARRRLVAEAVRQGVAVSEWKPVSTPLAASAPGACSRPS